MHQVPSGRWPWQQDQRARWRRIQRAADMKRWLTNPAEMEAKLDHKPKIKMSSKKAPLTNSEIDTLVAYLETLK